MIFLHRKIYLHLYVQCMIHIALCIVFFVCNGQYAKKTETFHQCTTTQVRANIFGRYSMDAKHKEGIWKNVNYHGSIFSFIVCFKHMENESSNLCLMSAKSYKNGGIDLGQKEFKCSSNLYYLAIKQYL